MRRHALGGSPQLKVTGDLNSLRITDRKNPLTALDKIAVFRRWRHLLAGQEGEKLAVGTPVLLVADHVDEVVHAVLDPVDTVDHDAHLLVLLLLDIDDVVDADGDHTHQEHKQELQNHSCCATTTEQHLSSGGLGPGDTLLSDTSQMYT